MSRSRPTPSSPQCLREVKLPNCNQNPCSQKCLFFASNWCIPPTPQPIIMCMPATMKSVVCIVDLISKSNVASFLTNYISSENVHFEQILLIPLPVNDSLTYRI